MARFSVPYRLPGGRAGRVHHDEGDRVAEVTTFALAGGRVVEVERVRMSAEDRRDLERYVAGAYKYAPLPRARLAGAVCAVLRERGVDTSGADGDRLADLARAELAVEAL